MNDACSYVATAVDPPSGEETSPSALCLPIDYAAILTTLMPLVSIALVLIVVARELRRDVSLSPTAASGMQP